MRRALYHGQTLGLNEPFLFKMSGRVVDLMKDAYPELLEAAPHVAKAVKVEEERYGHTTRVGLQKLDETYVTLITGKEIKFREWRSEYASHTGGLMELAESVSKGSSIKRAGVAVPEGFAGLIDGGSVFELHDTFGLRPDFVEDIVKNYGLTINRVEYERAMSGQRERARASWKAAEKKVALPLFTELAEKKPTVFEGYTQTASKECEILALVIDGKAVNEAPKGAHVEIVLDHTPFYAEAGGQIGDTGRLLTAPDGSEVAAIQDTYRPVTGLIVHKAVAVDRLEVGDRLSAQVDRERRDSTRRNHTATHLLHATLRKTLGTHVKQAGSLVAPDRLRFDFTHFAALDEQDLLDIEDLVNQHVLANEPVETQVMDLDTAVNSGAMALFGEKYADQVRVVSIDDFSRELCGGTHVSRTGEIGLFKIVSEGSVSAGTRRIEALTGEGVLKQLREASTTLVRLAEALRAKPDELLQAAEKLAETEKKLRKELESQQMKRVASQAGDLARQAREVKGVRVVSARVEVTDRAAMRQMVDDLRAKLNSGVIVLGSVSDGKVALIAAVTRDLTNRLDAGKIVKEAASYVEGSGGGRKDLAEAGGKNPARLDESLRAIPGIIERLL
jgi:alanyl-tRNA synthetase